MIANHHPDHYRPEIDGLRAIAVGSVVLFHAGVPGIGGGYVGVDIFFVISGFLIAQILLRDIDGGHFSFGRFYERRARRILPALFVVLLFASCLSQILLPYDLKQFSKSLAAVPLFVSNFLFWLGSDYFARNADTLPLLHTWSLAIEEQFYIVFPICLLLLARFGRRATVIAILALAAISLALCIEETLRVQKSGFYMPYARAWELMLGAYLAAAPGKPPGRLVAETASLSGIAAIAAAIFLFDNSTPFPGYWALLPCIGTALVLYGTRKTATLAGRILASKPLVAVGLISYSLYLWHWPLIVFASYYVVDPARITEAKAFAAAASIPMAYLSWRYIEQPFRRSPKLLTRKTLFIASFAASLVFCLAGVAGWAANGIPGRFPPFVEELTRKRFNNNADCDWTKHCIIGTAGSTPSFAIWGDSHAHALNNGLDHLARQLGVSGYAFYNLGCRPFIDDTVTNDCRKKNEAVVKALQSLHLRTVIITAEWSTGNRAKTRDALERALEKTVQAVRIGGAKTYIMLDVPASAQPVPETLAKYRILSLPTSPLNPTLKNYEQKNGAFNAVAQDLKKRGILQIVDPKPLLCPSGICTIAKGNTPFYMDDAHLNEVGAEKVSVLFKDILSKAPDRP